MSIENVKQFHSNTMGCPLDFDRQKTQDARLQETFPAEETLSASS